MITTRRKYGVVFVSVCWRRKKNHICLTGNFDECVRNETDDTVGCVSLMRVIPGICASEYAFPLLSFNGIGGILYGGAVFNVDFNDNLLNAAVKYDDWLSNELPVLISSHPADKNEEKTHNKMVVLIK